jgi:Fe-S-cluster containining protein
MPCAGTGCATCAAGETPVEAVFVNFFVLAERAMRVLVGDLDWLEDVLAIGRRFGLPGTAYSVENRGHGPTGLPRWLVLPSGPLGREDGDLVAQTPLYALDRVACGEGLSGPLLLAPPAIRRRPEDPIVGDLKTSLRFVHALAMQTRYMTIDNRARSMALVEELVAHGQVDLVSLEERRQAAYEREAPRFEKQVHVRLADNVDKYALTTLPTVDCAARRKVCQSRCCRLNFPLSVQDLDERVVEWDYAFPYQIRQGEDGNCVHWSLEQGCTVYEHRPAICRTYSCERDTRIWADFDRWILATDAPPATAPPAAAAAREEPATP